MSRRKLLPQKLLDMDFAEIEKRVLGAVPHLLKIDEVKKPEKDPAEEAAERLAGTYEPGTPLDRMGEQVGLVRLPGEEDDAYRSRILLCSFPPASRLPRKK